MIIVAIISTTVAWFIGGIIGTNPNSDYLMGTSLSTLFAILTMGSFILKAINDSNSKNDNSEK